MLLIFNKKINSYKEIAYALTTLYGINIYQSKKICKNIGIHPQSTIHQLKNHQINLLTKYINRNLKIEGLLKKKVKTIKQNLLEIKTYRGIRHYQGLPVNGQRSHTNAKTAKKNQRNKINIISRIKKNNCK